MTTLDHLAADAPASIRSVTITQARAVTYRLPAGPTESSRTNYVIQLDGRTVGRNGGQDFIGVGECQPRGRRTGDDAGDSWSFLQEVLRRCEGAEIPVNSPAESVAAIRRTLAELFDLATSSAAVSRHAHPFRGTLMGIDIALLDLAARAHGLTLAELLGQSRASAPIGPTALTVGMKSARARRRLAAQAGSYEQVRITGTADVAENLEFLEFVTAANSEPEIFRPEKHLWIDLNGALSLAQAEQLVDDVVRAASTRRLASTVLIEQPVPMSRGSSLVELQERINSRIAESEDSELDIRIVADESVWDVESLNDLDPGAIFRAVNIRPGQAGGLLAALDVAEAVVARNPQTLVFLTRMTGASQITAAALTDLALALPRVDAAYASAAAEKSFSVTRPTRSPAGHGEEPAGEHFRGRPGADLMLPLGGGTSAQRGTATEARPRPQTLHPVLRGSRSTHGNGVHRSSGETITGIGLDVDYPGLVNEVRDSVTFPEPPAPTNRGVAANVYEEVDHLHPLGPNGAKGHLLEREAIALGLTTERFSKGAFTVTDGQQVPISFKWSRNPLSSAVALALCTHKEATRIRLQQAGLPVPQGRTFGAGDVETAKQFAEHIGYPVVIKPAMGVRGIGVVAGIGDEEQFDAAFGIMTDSKLGDQDFIVEKHVSGEDYRILVVDGQVIAAIRRDPASVVGDGRSTVAELLIAKNTVRRRNPHLWARPARHDAAAQYELALADRTLDTVLPWGERQVLANTCSLSQGGDSIDVLDELHPTIREACVQAVEAVPGMKYCGVDFLLEDHTKPLDAQDAGICELNAHAAIGNCEYPMFGTPRPVARTLMRASVENYGLQTRSAPADEVALRITVRGRVTSVGYRRWVKRRAEAAGLTGWVRNLAARRVEVVLVGPTTPATALASALVLGPARAQPTSYQAQSIDVPETLEDFAIMPDAHQDTEAAQGSGRMTGLLRVLGL